MKKDTFTRILLIVLSIFFQSCVSHRPVQYFGGVPGHRHSVCESHFLGLPMGESEATTAYAISKVKLPPEKLFAIDFKSSNYFGLFTENCVLVTERDLLVN